MLTMCWLFTTQESTDLLIFLSPSFVFPSLQTLGEDLVTVLDYLHVKYVIGLGEGAG
jgi:hypothetical protein